MKEKKTIFTKKLITIIVITIMLAMMMQNNVFAAAVVVDRCYSIYTPTNYNDPMFVDNGDGTGYSTNPNRTEYLQSRMNCYAYAMQMFYDGPLTTNSYAQQPGEFRSIANASKVISPIVVRYNPTTTMNNIVTNMQLDFARLGYSIGEYSTTLSTVPQYANGLRLIALVTGNTDYHYYMQNSNGTWSHKPGGFPVTNISSDTDPTKRVPITNANIKTKANQGNYYGGKLKFFLINKDAVLDYPHGTYPTSSTSETSLNYKTKDMAGEERITAQINGASTQANIDFHNDNDTYRITTTNNLLTITTTGSLDLDCKVFEAEVSNTTPIAYDYGLGNVNFTYYVQTGKTLYIKIYSHNKTKGPYALNVRYL